MTKGNKIFITVMALLTVFLSVFGSYGIILLTNNSKTVKVRNIADYKNIEIKDEGISAAVLKVYDAVVVVETYKNDRLYATGTGFVFKEDDDYGYIMTNYHVVESGTNIKVRFTDGDIVDVSVVGSDAYSDIAVLKVSKEYVLTVAEMGNVNDTLLGDTLFAIGSPIDADTYSWTVTRGILSGKDRIVEVKNENTSFIMNVLQTDVAINSGNSGGPLCTSNGKVIGVINLKLSSSNIEGIGFAIPINEALEYADNFINGNPIIRPYLGVSMYDLSSSIFSSDTGVYLKEVDKDSPAYVAGLRSGDVITSIDNIEVKTSAYLKFYLYKHKAGDVVDIKYKRKGVENTTKVALGSHDIRG